MKFPEISSLKLLTAKYVSEYGYSYSRKEKNQP